MTSQRTVALSLGAGWSVQKKYCHRAKQREKGKGEKSRSAGAGNRTLILAATAPDTSHYTTPAAGDLIPQLVYVLVVLRHGITYHCHTEKPKEQNPKWHRVALGANRGRACLRATICGTVCRVGAGRRPVHTVGAHSLRGGVVGMILL